MTSCTKTPGTMVVCVYIHIIVICKYLLIHNGNEGFPTTLITLLFGPLWFGSSSSQSGSQVPRRKRLHSKLHSASPRLPRVLNERIALKSYRGRSYDLNYIPGSRVIGSSGCIVSRVSTHLHINALGPYLSTEILRSIGMGTKWVTISGHWGPRISQTGVARNPNPLYMNPDRSSCWILPGVWATIEASYAASGYAVSLSCPLWSP